MPIYEYKCDECGAVSEVLVKNTANQLTVVCSSCQSSNVTRLISAPAAVRIKGSGYSADIPPINCPNVNKCGVPSSSCPAARSHNG
jgi:putative FmdB family regulatory protein